MSNNLLPNDTEVRPAPMGVHGEILVDNTLSDREVRELIAKKCRASGFSVPANLVINIIPYSDTENKIVFEDMY